MTPLVFALVLFAAFCHAVWNAVVKSGQDRLVAQTLVIGVAGLLGAPLLFFLPLPNAEAWPYLLTSTLVHQVYYFLLISAYRHGDLSQVYPIARGSAPALVALGAWILAGEVLQLWEIAGLAVITFGIVSLSGFRRQGTLHGIVFALLTGLSIAAYSVTDGLGVRLSGNAASYILWLFLLEALPLIAFTLWARRGGLRASFAPQWKAGFMGGVIAGMAYGIAIWAMSQAPLAQVVALRETSVVIAAFIGTRLLGEPFGRSRMTAAVLVATGVAVMKLA